MSDEQTSVDVRKAAELPARSASQAPAESKPNYGFMAMVGVFITGAASFVLQTLAPTPSGVVRTTQRGLATSEAAVNEASRPTRRPENEQRAPAPNAAVQPAWDETSVPDGTAPADTKSNEDELALESEVRSAWQGVGACLDVAQFPPGTDHVSLSARVHITATGRVTRADVSGAGLSLAARECMEQHAEGFRFQHPPASGTATVATQLTFAVKPSPTSTAAAPQPSQPRAPEGYAPAAAVLPARAPSTPAAGYVPPAAVLPIPKRLTHPDGYAQPAATLPIPSEITHPDGYVPPAEVLPIPQAAQP